MLAEKGSPAPAAPGSPRSYKRCCVRDPPFAGHTFKLSSNFDLKYQTTRKMFWTGLL